MGHHMIIIYLQERTEIKKPRGGVEGAGESWKEVRDENEYGGTGGIPS